MKARNPNTGNLETIYVKALDSLPVGSEIDIEDGSDIPVGWEEVTNPDSYSTTEVKTNKTWIDGRPIYRKVIRYTNAMTAGSNNIPHNISNIGTIVNVYGYCPFGTQNPYFLGAMQSATKFLSIRSATTTTIGVDVGSEWGNSFTLGCIITIEYTKTTD